MKFRSLLYFFIVVLLSACGAKKKSVVVELPDEFVSVAPVDTVVLPMFTDIRDVIVSNALTWLGTPYLYAGEDKNGVDCSGFVMRVFEDATGVKIPRNSAEQQRFAKPIDRNLLEKGDLVFFTSKRGGDSVSHVGIVVDSEDFIHASSSRGVIISSLSEDYYVRYYHSGGRIIENVFTETEVSKSEVKNDSTACARPGDKEVEAIRDAVRRAMLK